MPVKKDRRGYYKIQSGERVRVCMNSDFFLAEADPWRDEAWQIMKKRSDVIFFLLTKRPERVAAVTARSARTGACRAGHSGGRSVRPLPCGA